MGAFNELRAGEPKLKLLLAVCTVDDSEGRNCIIGFSSGAYYHYTPKFRDQGSIFRHSMSCIL
jgi:hypothetical protein